MARGSKPGERRGGRQKGTPNRKTAETVAKIEASGLTPLDFMLSVLRDEQNEQAVRLDAAHKAAPYVHARLSNVQADHTNSDGSLTQPPSVIQIVAAAHDDGDGSTTH